jgi:hypothetical protein
LRDGGNLLHAAKCSECLTVVFANRYSVVWTKEIRRNGMQHIFSKVEQHRLN